MTAAAVGRIVHVLVDPADNNGADVAPAVITRVWGEPHVDERDGLGERVTINAHVLLDQRTTRWVTSALLFSHRPSAEQLEAKNPYNPKGHNTVAFWPPHV